MHIEMGDDERHRSTGLGTATFQRDFGNLFTLKDVMHVPRLKNNFVYVAMLEYRGSNVIFSEGKAFLRHKAMGQVKNIGVQVKNLYKLDVQDWSALRMKT